MAIFGGGWLLSALRPALNHVVTPAMYPAHMQVREYAARKGTRLRKFKINQANKKKNQALYAKKKALLEKKAKSKMTGLMFKDDSLKPEIPSVDIYVARYYRWPVYSFEQAIEYHRETHHPSMFGEHDAVLDAYVELNLETKKKTKFIEKIDRIVVPPHTFDQRINKNILFLSEDPANLKIALEAGANVAENSELLKQIQNGTYSLEEHDYCLAHPDILPKLLLVKGIFRSKLPIAKDGSLSSDVKNLVSRFKNGIHYKLEKSNIQNNYGIINAPFGTLDMDVKQLEENFATLLRDIMEARRLDDRKFILRTRILCEPSTEKFVVDHEQYVSHMTKKVQPKDEEDDEDEIDETGVIGAV